jgi:hypothetical protein
MKHRIHVPSLHDPETLLEVDAEPEGEGRFRLLGGESAMPLRFKRGEIVECEIRRMPDGKSALVAIESVSSDPEFRRRRNVYAVLGAMVGAIFGAALALWFEVSSTSAAIGAVLGAVVFAYCSARWGDRAWVILSRIFG